MNSSFVEIQQFPIAGDGFTISRETKTDANVVYVQLTRNGYAGDGECVPLKRYGHTTESIKAEIEEWLSKDHEWTRDNLIATLPAGPARFALDTAMWRLEAAEKDLSFAEYFSTVIPDLIGDPALDWLAPPSRSRLRGNDEKGVLATAFTLSGAAPETMAAMAKTRLEFRWLKIKLMGDGNDGKRLHQIHQVAPETELIVDANEALAPEVLQKILPILQQNNVVLIEQPLPADNDDALKEIDFPIPFAADESCHDISSLEKLVGKYQVVNIKLDKCGGLTHGLHMKRRAQELGFQIMVGCMASTSLSILPAFFLAQDATFIDLDGALLLKNDRPNAEIDYWNGTILLR